MELKTFKTLNPNSDSQSNIQGEEDTLKIPILSKGEGGRSENDVLRRSSETQSDLEEQRERSPPSTPGKRHNISADQTWHYLEQKTFFQVVREKVWLIPLLIIFMFLYFGFLNLLLYLIFPPDDSQIRISEVFISMVTIDFFSLNCQIYNRFV